jgi:hypothetical protein
MKYPWNIKTDGDQFYYLAIFGVEYELLFTINKNHLKCNYPSFPCYKKRMQERGMVNIMLVILESSKDGADDDNDNIKKTTTNKTYTALFNDPRLKEYWDVLTQEGLLSYDS